MSVIVSSAGQALADDTPGAELLSTGTKASSLGIDIGASIGMSSSGTNFDLHLNYTHHFSGDASGFNLGADLDIIAGEGEQAFLVPAVRAGYDHEVALGVYLAPFASLGPVIGTKGYIGFDARFGLGVKLIMNDLWIVNVQPVGVDLVVGTEGVDVRYSLLFGGGIIF